MRLGLTIVTLCISCSSTLALDDADKSAIVHVEVRGQTAKGSYIRLGTGFLVGKGKSVITARHLLHPDAPWTKDDVAQTDRYSVYVKLKGPGGLYNDQRRAAVDAEDETSDVALLSFDGNPASKTFATCPEVEISGNPMVTALGYGATVANDGNDASSDASLSVSSGALNDPNEVDHGQYRISAATRFGFSGAPVFLDDRVVGMLTGGTDGRLATSANTVFTPLRKLRGKLLAPCDSQCSLPEHGIEKYRNHEQVSFSSDWSPDRAAPGNFCETLLKDHINLASGRKFILQKVTEFMSQAADGTNVPTQYKYECSFEGMWGEIYKVKADPLCPKDEIQALPR